ncbi:hypothetical protein BE61_75730 [Bradyrhizobium elkanii USDA 61]|nr:hypothetical protein BE61_75730 [Bradyrhizobium elkanii USDA 61]
MVRVAPQAALLTMRVYPDGERSDCAWRCDASSSAIRVRALALSMDRNPSPEEPQTGYFGIIE